MLHHNTEFNDDLIREHAITANKRLKGKCRFCPRGFESGEKIVFITVKNIQMKWLEEDIEKAEPAGFGEQHLIEITNAHLSCAIDNADKIRSVVSRR